MGQVSVGPVMEIIYTFVAAFVLLTLLVAIISEGCVELHRKRERASADASHLSTSHPLGRFEVAKSNIALEEQRIAASRSQKHPIAGDNPDIQVDLPRTIAFIRGMH